MGTVTPRKSTTAVDDQHAPEPADTSRIDAATDRFDAAFTAIACRPTYDASNRGSQMAAELVNAALELRAAIAEDYAAREAARSGS